MLMDSCKYLKVFSIRTHEMAIESREYKLCGPYKLSMGFLLCLLGCPREDDVREVLFDIMGRSYGVILSSEEVGF